MGDGGNVADAGDGEAGALQGADGGFAARPGAFDININQAQAHIHAVTGGLLGGALGGKSGPLAGAAEARSAGAGGGDYIAIRVGDADQVLLNVE